MYEACGRLTCSLAVTQHRHESFTSAIPDPHPNSKVTVEDVEQLQGACRIRCRKQGLYWTQHASRIDDDKNWECECETESACSKTPGLCVGFPPTYAVREWAEMDVDTAIVKTLAFRGTLSDCAMECARSVGCIAFSRDVDAPDGDSGSQCWLRTRLDPEKRVSFVDGRQRTFIEVPSGDLAAVDVPF